MNPIKLIVPEELKSGAIFGGVFDIICRRPDGSIRWKERADNLVTNAGIQHILDAVFSGATQKATWYLGLMSATPTVAATDTLASHAGWTENTAYADDRKEWVEVRSAQSMTNSASKGSFAINADSQSIGGAFLCAAATGTAEILMSAAAFTGGNKPADNGDTLEVTYTFSGADDGA